jgi:hypothetical protein
MGLLARGAVGCITLVVVYFGLSALYFGGLFDRVNSAVVGWGLFATLVIACFVVVRFVHR